MTVRVWGAPGSGASTLSGVLTGVDLPDPAAVCTLIVVEPSAVAGDIEQQLLADAAHDDGPIALVCTKIDLFWDWPSILRRTRDVLDPDHRLPVFAVAATSGAGCSDLIEWISDGPAPHRWAPQASSAASSEDSPSTPVRATGRAERLSAVRVSLNQERAVVLAAVTEGLRDIAAAAAQMPPSVPRRSVVDAVDHALGSMVRGTEAALEQRVAAVDLVAMAGTGIAPAQLAAPPMAVPPLPELPTRRGGGESALVLVFGASVGLGIGRLAMAGLHELTAVGGVLAMAPWLTMVVAMCCGVAVASWAVVVRTRASGRAAVDTWVSQALGVLRSRMEAEVTARILAAEAVISTRINRYYQR